MLSRWLPALLGSRRGVRRPASPRSRASRSISGRAPMQQPPCAAVSGSDDGSSPLLDGRGSSAVRSTTSARCRPKVSTAPPAGASWSRRALLRPAIASAGSRRPSRRGSPAAGCARRGRRRRTRPGRRPCRQVASSRAASIARPAGVRRPRVRPTCGRCPGPAPGGGRVRAARSAPPPIDSAHSPASRRCGRRHPLTYSRRESNSSPATHPDRGTTVELARRASRLGRCRMRGRRQHAQCPGHLDRTLPPGEAERT